VDPPPFEKALFHIFNFEMSCPIDIPQTFPDLSFAEFDDLLRIDAVAACLGDTISTRLKHTIRQPSSEDRNFDRI
jgi:hypothetical protein